MVIGYASRSTTPAESNYGVTDLECVGIDWALTKFRCYTDGHPITVITDHQALQALMKKGDAITSRRLQQLYLRIQGHNVDVRYRPGKEMGLPDYLSRHPVEAMPWPGEGLPRTVWHGDADV